MKRCCKAESIDESAKRKITKREYKRKWHKDESIDVLEPCKKIIRENLKRHFMAESHDTAAAGRSNDNTSKKRKRNGQQHNVSTVCYNEEMTNAIKCSMKKAKWILHRKQYPANPHCHRTIVCITCDQFIIGTETIHKLTNDQISKHSNRLSVQTYESYHGQVLKPKLRKWYQVNVDGLKDMLLSPWSRKYNNGYANCTYCYKGMCPNLANKRTPPKFAIANGLW